MINLKIYCKDSSGRYTEQFHIETIPCRLSGILRNCKIPIPFDCGGRGTCGRCCIRILRESDHLYRSWSERKTIPFSEVEEAVSAFPACQTILDESAILFTPPPQSAASDTDFPFHSSEAGSVPYGAAVDLGSTSIAVKLLNLTTGEESSSVTCWNPQKIYGSDLITRLAVLTDDPQKRNECRRITIGAVTELLCTLAHREKIPLSQIERVAAAGNSVMSYFFLGLDPKGMTIPPYDPPLLTFPAQDAEAGLLPISPRGTVITLPILCNLIGGDLTAGIIALQKTPEFNFTFGRSGPELFIDIGTNGEILLFTEKKIYAAQTAAGPVFEGGEISSGMRADPGAVVHLRITGTAPILNETCDSGRIQFETAGNLPPIGLAGSGLIDLAAELLRTGDLKGNGRLCRTVEIAPNLTLTQKDIRALQLALGAIRAGMAVLLEKAQIRWTDLKAFYVAGGLGSGLDPESARRLGLFPCELDSSKIIPCGNTSLAGALAVLREPEIIDTAEEIRKRICHIQLAGSKSFEEEFIRGMIFPQ